MRKPITYLLIALLFMGCTKGEEDALVHYAEAFEISFKLDGKLYSKAYERNRMNPVVRVQFMDNNMSYDFTGTQGPMFEIGDTMEIDFMLGYHRYLFNDTTASYNSLQQLLRPGNKDYRCMTICSDSTVRDGVEVAITERQSVYWRSVRTDEHFKPLPIPDEQTGSKFTITEIKPSTNNGINRNAFIIKGTFNCNLYNSATQAKKVLTDGRFTCILHAF